MADFTGNIGNFDSASKVRLTRTQKALLGRDMFGLQFIQLYSRGDDVVAQNLQSKGLGVFTNFKWSYSWRGRSGYINHFTPSERGRNLRASILHEANQGAGCGV